MTRTTPGKTYGSAIAAEWKKKTRPVPRMKCHRLGLAYCCFKIQGKRRWCYFGQFGTQAAQAKYQAFARVWPSQLSENTKPKGRWPPPRILTHDDRTQNIARWAAEIGVKATTLRFRIDRLCWSPEKALTTPT